MNCKPARTVRLARFEFGDRVKPITSPNGRFPGRLPPKPAPGAVEGAEVDGKNKELHWTITANEMAIFPVGFDLVGKPEERNHDLWERVRSHPKYLELCDDVDFLDSGLSVTPCGGERRAALCEKQRQAMTVFGIRELIDPRKEYDALGGSFINLFFAPVRVRAIAPETPRARVEWTERLVEKKKDLAQRVTAVDVEIHEMRRQDVPTDDPRYLKALIKHEALGREKAELRAERAIPASDRPRFNSPQERQDWFNAPQRFIEDGRYIILKIDITMQDGPLRDLIWEHVKYLRQFTPEQEKEQREHLSTRLSGYRILSGRREGKPFSELAAKEGVSIDTAKKRFRTAFELIQGVPYERGGLKSLAVFKSQLRRACDVCQDRECEETGEPCEDVRAFIEQDFVDQPHYIPRRNVFFDPKDKPDE